MRKIKRFLVGLLSLSITGMALLSSGCMTVMKFVIGPGEGVVYELSEDGTYYTVVDYSGGDYLTVIPDEYNGLPVKVIATGSLWEAHRVSIPDSVVEIEEDAFPDDMVHITVENGNPNYSSKNGVLYNKDKTELIRFASENNHAEKDEDGVGESFSIPSTVKVIAKRAFVKEEGLREVKIPDSVVRIEEEAFKYCSNLQKVQVGSSVTYIGKGVFIGCDNIRYRTYENGIYLGNENNPYVALIDVDGEAGSCSIHKTTQAIAEDVFTDCAVTKINVDSDSNSYQSVDGNLYSKDGTRLLKYVNIQDRVLHVIDSVTSIDKTVLISSNITSIQVAENNAVYQSIDGILYNKDGTTLVRYPSSKSSFEIPESVETVASYAFYNSPVREVEMKESVLNIEPYAFAYSDLVTVTIPDRVTTISEYAFYECGYLNSVTIGERVTTIGNSAFAFCALSEVIIPDRLVNIGDYAFNENTNSDAEPCLEKVVVGDSVAKIGYRAFGGKNNNSSNRGTSALKSIEVTVYNTTYQSIDGNLYTKDGKTLIQYALGKEDASFIVPKGVERIEDAAFYCCDALMSVEISDTVTSIGKEVFNNCSKLTSVEMSDSVTTIGAKVFQDCRALTNIQLSNSLKEISAYMFKSCTSLESIIIPDSVTEIRHHSFWNCTKLNDIKFGNGVERIEGQAFLDCKALTSIELFDSVIYIGAYAFSRCEKLEEVIFPASVKYLGNSLFKGCPELTSLTYKGKARQWKTIPYKTDWDEDSQIEEVVCKNKTIQL